MSGWLESLKGRNGAPREIRTPGLLIRSQSLYPAELWAHEGSFPNHLQSTKKPVLGQAWVRLWGLPRVPLRLAAEAEAMRAIPR
jgi:hypothetical protein